MVHIINKKECFIIIGICMEVHNNLGSGFLEVVYKDALEYEFQKAGISFCREKVYDVCYKGRLLPHKFYSDFEVFENIILEIKALSMIDKISVAQAINYLKVSGNKLALIINFGALSLEYRRIIY